jgi:hypothetical protein
MKYKVVLYQEVYTTIEVEAQTVFEAEEKVLTGDWDEKDEKDVTVKESNVLHSESVFSV